MTKASIFSCVAMATIVSVTFGDTYAQVSRKSFEVSAFSVYQSLSPNQKAIEKTRTVAASQFPGWKVTCDKISGAVSDLYGKPVDLAGTTTTEKAATCLSGQLKPLAINPAEWVIVSNFDAPRASYVYYKQVVAGHDVVFSQIGFRFTKDGQLQRIQIKNYGSPSNTMKPAITTADVQSAVTSDIDGMTITGSTADKQWSWFPIPSAKGYELHPAWHFLVSGNVAGSVPLKLSAWVDAINGKLLYRTNEVKETAYDLTVKGMVYKNGMLLPPSLEPLPDLEIMNGATTIYTDSTGHATDAGTTLPATSVIPLMGHWSTVIDSTTGLNPSFFDTVSAAGTVFTYPTTAPSSDRHVNAYYHVNRIHNFMKKYYPTFTGMDFSLPTKVDEIGGTCNAFYDGTSINFYAEDVQCHSFATFGDVIYHEYGHGITDHMYTDITGSTIVNGALNEANSDIWALSITHNPVLAADAFIGYGGFIRRYDMTPQVYPIDLNTSILADVHQNGQIIAGTWWDVGQNIGVVDTMTRIFSDVYYDVPDGPTGTEGAVYQAILIDALMADDNNNDLSDGTPHYAAIVKAFARHGIYLEGDVTITHSEITNQPRDADITVSAALTMSRPEYLTKLMLAYRINDTGAWQMSAMTNGGASFTGTIPGQPRGTVVSYKFILQDSLNADNAYFPITCNGNNPDWQSSIPYQFGVGLVGADSNSFEGSTAGWGVSGNPGDDATAGLWNQIVPSTSLFASFINLTAWPGTDHTSGSGQCLQTGNSAASLANFYGTGVSSGTTTVYTPVFDVSGFLNPVVSYYRWFSNDQNTNFKNDPWIVIVGDTAGNWQTVERTYQSDVNWRRRIFQLHSYLPGATKFSVRFFASDSILSNWAGNGQSLSIGALDDFFLYDIDTTDLAVASLKNIPATIFPNPADQTITIRFSDNKWAGDLSLYDVTGNLVGTYTIQAGNVSFSIPVGSLANGSYMLLLKNEKFIQTKTIQISHGQ